MSALNSTREGDRRVELLIILGASLVALGLAYAVTHFQQPQNPVLNKTQPPQQQVTSSSILSAVWITSTGDAVVVNYSPTLNRNDPSLVNELEAQGFIVDPLNTSTSTEKDPLYVIRTGLINPRTGEMCLVSADYYIGLGCFSKESLLLADQAQKPFRKALGLLGSGAYANATTSGTFAEANVGIASMGSYFAILEKDGRGGWSVIYKGQEPPDCSLMQKFKVPSSTYGQCWDSQSGSYIGNGPN